MDALVGSLSLTSLTLPLLIFLAEMCVVTLGTIRIIFVSRGMKLLATGLGFFEVAVWLFAIGQIMQNLSDLSCYAAFAGGFSVGNFCGILIEKKLAIGTQVVRTVTSKDAGQLVGELKTAGYGVTRVEGQGAVGPVQIVLTVIKRKQLPNVLAIIKRFDPKAFYAIDDVQDASEGVFPAARRGVLPGVLRLRRAA